LGRYDSDITAAEEMAALSEEDMERRIADMKAVWDDRAAPMALLLARLSELQEDLTSRNVVVDVIDKTLFPVENTVEPLIEFRLVKPNAHPARQSPWFRVTWAQGGYRITSGNAPGDGNHSARGAGYPTLEEEVIDDLVRRAVKEYPWWP
jgi:hypothetical protein